MPEQPLLIFPTPITASRDRLSPAPPRIHLPPQDRQAQRLNPKFDLLRGAFEAGAPAIRTTAAGAEPEQVIVLETVGSISDFRKAVQMIHGLEWLAEWDQEDVPPDEDFYLLNKDEEADARKLLTGRLFLIMSNQRGMDQLISLWERYRDDPTRKLSKGLNKFKDVFKRLRDVRRWGEQDRLHETGMLEYWRDALEDQRDRIRFEAEFWYRADKPRRTAQFERFHGVVQEVGGICLSECAIPEIAYHAAVVELPPASVRAILDQTDVRILRSNDIMFFHPIGQCATEPPEEFVGLREVEPPEPLIRLREPVAALLDGFPLENHRVLSGRLILDDPDDWASSYPAEDRQHGTSMASLIAHGDLDCHEKPLERALYVRPIMQPNPYSGQRPRGECIPESFLPADLLHRAVRRMFEKGEGTGPAAPSVRIINLSLGDPNQLFDYRTSAWARVLDWLSWHYKVLFVVSVGNHGSEITVDPVDGNLPSEPGELERRAIQSLAAELRHRRLLSPAESINSITVGASHDDYCVDALVGNRVDLFTVGLPSPGNALGLGFQRSVKPDILLPGGRQLYRRQPVLRDGRVSLKPVVTTQPPGIRVAMPGAIPGDLSRSGYRCGSSNAAALATRGAIGLFDRLLSLRDEPGGTILSDRYLAVLIKALLVHGASWDQGLENLQAALKEGSNDPRLKTRITRFLGYGVAHLERVLRCTEQRATLIGCGSLVEDRAHEYSIPLPPSLGGRTDWRRLTITLAWFTPINPLHHRYRRAHLWFEASHDRLRVSRSQVDWRTVRRGTVQHEVMEGDGACVISGGDSLTLAVNCRSDAGSLEDEVPYAIAVTLEVAEHLDIPVYDEIKVRLRPRIVPPGAV